MPAEFYCLACGESFWDLKRFSRHRYRDHAGDLDAGTALHNAGRKRISSLLADDECPDPPRLDG